MSAPLQQSFTVAADHTDSMSIVSASSPLSAAILVEWTLSCCCDCLFYTLVGTHAIHLVSFRLIPFAGKQLCDSNWPESGHTCCLSTGHVFVCFFIIAVSLCQHLCHLCFSFLASTSKVQRVEALSVLSHRLTHRSHSACLSTWPIILPLLLFQLICTWYFQSI